VPGPAQLVARGAYPLLERLPVGRVVAVPEPVDQLVSSGHALVGLVGQAPIGSNGLGPLDQRVRVVVQPGDVQIGHHSVDAFHDLDRRGPIRKQALTVGSDPGGEELVDGVGLPRPLSGRGQRVHPAQIRCHRRQQMADRLRAIVTPTWIAAASAPAATRS
jgi:hypothetical protein